MNFPRLTFPLTVDFGNAGYWIGDVGPFYYGAAVTEFFCEDDLADDVGDGLLLIRRLEDVLKAFGGHLQPYVVEQQIPVEMFLQPEKSEVNCSICLAFHPVADGAVAMVERYTFSCLRDFLYIELAKAISKGNAPRQCRLCGHWFLHVQGDKTIYCNRIAPGETDKTCRDVGARAVFENKIQSEETWKIYKRAYKKYYARYMKGNLSEAEFKAWGEQAAAQRDTIRLLLEGTRDPEKQTELIERLREELNKR